MGRDNVFARCDSLADVHLPKGLKSIGAKAFLGCKNIEQLELPKGITEIGSDAFFDCENLQELTIPSKVTSLREETFKDCSSLASATIPSTVTTIGSSAFIGCSSLKVLYYNGTSDDFDLTPAYKWLTENAHKYGFILRYTSDKREITGIVDEPWHWRYVGVETATAMKGTGLCLEEYLANAAVES